MVKSRSNKYRFLQRHIIQSDQMPGVFPGWPGKTTSDLEHMNYLSKPGIAFKISLSFLIACHFILRILTKMGYGGIKLRRPEICFC